MSNKIYTAKDLRKIAENFNIKKDIKTDMSLKVLVEYFSVYAEKGYMNYTAFHSDDTMSVIYNATLKYKDELEDLGFKIIKVINNDDKVHRIIISWE